MTKPIPNETRAVVVQKTTKERQAMVYHDAVVKNVPIPQLKTGQILVKMGAVAFNHRDVWIRKGMYPGIGFGSVFGADGAGTVVDTADPKDPLLRKRVFISPSRGWRQDPDGPETAFGVIGGVRYPPIGTFSEYVVVERDEVILSPDHLDDIHVAAWPLGGVTAWRATMINARVQPGHNVLITGIGGGVALIALQLCLAKGANVYVTSGSQEKIDKAVALGAKGGAIYKDQDWPKKIAGIFKGKFDSVIDSGGDDIITQMSKYLKHSGRVVCYGMTGSPTITFTMREVMQNQQLIGSTMGSYKDLEEATKFLSEHKITPMVSHVVRGLQNVEEGFEMMRKGEQFGKIVVALGGVNDFEFAKL